LHLNDNTDIAAGHGRSVVGTVTSHGTELAKTLEALDAGVGLGRIIEGANDALINAVLVLGTRGIGSEEDNVLGQEGAVGLDELLVDCQLVGGQGTGLVRTEDSDTSQLFNGSDTGDNCLALGELLSTDGG
jgi:hypothetical protein